MNRIFLGCSLFLTAAILSQCVTTAKIDTSSVSVAEEGGITFTKISNEEDAVMGPGIQKGMYNAGNTKFQTIRWYAAPFIGLSPDSSYVAYVCSNSGNANIYLKRTAGGSSVIQRTFKGGVMDMSYAPDSKYICFSDNSDGNQNIYTINATEGAAIQQITSSGTAESGGVYSKDGKIIFYTKEEAGVGANGLRTSRYYVWGYNKETSLMTQYCEGFTPCPLPDNKRLLVTRGNKETGCGEIWIIDLKSGLETQIIGQRDKSCSSPDISADGKTIVMVSNTSGSSVRPMNLDLYTIRTDGTGLTQLTFHPGEDVSPKWAPNGREIYFISSRGNAKGSFGVWKMDYRKQ
jgi:Tol biopolymer transport system component